ncbi:hypothetical protein ES705_41549 [subsurface metagenome]
MSKERLSKLQKWILGKLNNAKTNCGYYRPYRRRDLVKEYEKDFPEELTKEGDELEKRTGRKFNSQWIHYCWNHQFQVVLTNSLKNLRKKDLITIYGNDDIRLTDKGTLLIEVLNINKTHFINIKELE